MLTIALVIGVHSVNILPQASGGIAAGAFITVFHVSRQVFVVLTTLVLVHVYGRRPVSWVAFWRRRYALVAVPYAVWTLIYLIVDGQRLDPLSSFLVALGRDLLLGASRYHLYFLLVTMQIYLCFPLIRWFLRATERHHGIVFAACLAYQVVFALAVQNHWATGGVLGAWLRGPNAVLPSYLLYVAVGGIAAWHLDTVLALVRQRHRRLLACGAASIGLAVAVYLARVTAGASEASATAVFQPDLVVESLGMVAIFFAFGIMWADRGRPARRFVTTISDASFGIYLVHPLLLEVLAVDFKPALAGLPVAVALLIVVPVIYAGSTLLTMLARRGPLSLALTGRPRQVREAIEAAPHATAAAAPAGARAV